ncbi:MAG: zinc-binding dehydrogenase [Anaerolineae bacterium]|nr:zinc-binding dehydrogenase [Thermoflexales bacterium]MDW8406563.1 zinc-binding dehydrogenase [Anaerolineae bacterium]
MKAIRLVKPGHPLEAHEVPIPEIGPTDVLVQVKAAGICHSDAHYRAGVSPAGPLPITLGHEIAGIVEQVGKQAHGVAVGDRVCVHYLATCGHCTYCHRGTEQFCTGGQMIGKHRDGGYAEYLRAPARSVFKLPDDIPFEHGAIMMCSSATALHALRKARIQAGDSVAVFGAGGLGLSAVQLAHAMGALHVYAVDIKETKLSLARQFGAIPIDARAGDPVEQIMAHTGGRGVDIALELIGLPLTMRQAVWSLAVGGRAALAGITQQGFEVVPYHELINKEAEIIGVSDHLAQEIPLLLEYARQGALNLKPIVTRHIPLDATAVNVALDELERFSDAARVVIVMERREE